MISNTLPLVQNEAIAHRFKRYPIFCYSKLQEDFVRRCHLIPAPDPQKALNGVLDRLAPDARIACVPQSGLTLPHLDDAEAALSPAGKDLDHVRDYAGSA